MKETCEVIVNNCENVPGGVDWLRKGRYSIINEYTKHLLIKIIEVIVII